MTKNTEALLVIVGVLSAATAILMFFVAILLLLQVSVCFGQCRVPKGCFSQHKSLFDRRLLVPEAPTQVSETSVTEVTREICRDPNTA